MLVPPQFVANGSWPAAPLFAPGSEHIIILAHGLVFATLFGPRSFCPATRVFAVGDKLLWQGRRNHKV